MNFLYHICYNFILGVYFIFYYCPRLRRIAFLFILSSLPPSIASFQLIFINFAIWQFQDFRDLVTTLKGFTHFVFAYCRGLQFVFAAASITQMAVMQSAASYEPIRSHLSKSLTMICALFISLALSSSR